MVVGSVPILCFQIRRTLFNSYNREHVTDMYSIELAVFKNLIHIILNLIHIVLMIEILSNLFGIPINYSKIIDIIFLETTVLAVPRKQKMITYLRIVIKIIWKLYHVNIVPIQFVSIAVNEPVPIPLAVQVSKPSKQTPISNQNPSPVPRYTLLKMPESRCCCSP